MSPIVKSIDGRKFKFEFSSFSIPTDSYIGWSLSCFAKTELDKDQPFIKNGLAELLKRQKPDGSWSSEDGETFDAGTTIEAVKVLKHYNLWLP